MDLLILSASPNDNGLTAACAQAVIAITRRTRDAMLRGMAETARAMIAGIVTTPK